MTFDGATQRLRIAIALLVLRHKPPGQSLSSYLIDLRAQFPLDPILVETPPAHGQDHRLRGQLYLDDPWRQRALTLEEENEALKLRIQKQEIQILASKCTQSLEDSPQVGTALHSSQPPKKKRKHNQNCTAKQAHKQDLRALIKDIRSGPSLPALRDSLDVLTLFQAIQNSSQSEASLFPSGSEEMQETALVLNVKRSITALEKLIKAAISRDTSLVATSSRVDVVNCLCNLLISLLNSTLSPGSQNSILTHILGDLTLSIVRPIIRGFHTLSEQGITLGLRETGRKAVPDIRPDFLSILSRLLDCIRSLKASTRDLREFMIFETVKSIELLWGKTAAQTLHGELTREQRITKLARKDSLWYHCSILHLALDRLSPAPRNETDEMSLLPSAVFQSLAELPHHFEHQVPVDEVARGMVLAVVEKAWLRGLYEPTSEEPK